MHEKVGALCNCSVLLRKEIDLWDWKRALNMFNNISHAGVGQCLFQPT